MKGKVVLVTGTGGGVGKDIVGRYAEEGISVITVGFVYHITGSIFNADYGLAIRGLAKARGRG